MIFQKHPINGYSGVINQIDKKETFSVLLTSNNSANLEKTLNYYEEAYNIKVEYLDINFNNKNFNELVKKTSLNVLDSTQSMFLVIKKGKVAGSLMGDFTEKHIKDLLISSKMISDKYKDIDSLIGNDLKEYKDKKSYSILYINRNDKDLYEYRKLFVKNNIRSLIMYEGDPNQIKTIDYFNKQLGYKFEPSEKLPILIKIRNNKILYYYSNVKLKDLVKTANLQD